MEFQFNDGGRAAAGFKGAARDCVVRAIAIAAELPYSEVYALVNGTAARERRKGGRRSSARCGVYKSTFRQILAGMGWEWVPTMGIGTGCKVHLNASELPAGRLIVSVSRHLCAVVDGVLMDNHDCSRGGARCVYGYFRKAEKKS